MNPFALILNVADMVIDSIKDHEGFRARPYKDSTGHETIGYGTNIDKGLTEEEADMLLRFRLNKLLSQLATRAPFDLDVLPQQCQQALAQMAYNLGVGGLLRFKRMWAALERLDFDEAADEALDSKWAEQVGQRARDIAGQIRACKYRVAATQARADFR